MWRSLQRQTFSRGRLGSPFRSPFPLSVLEAVVKRDPSTLVHTPSLRYTLFIFPSTSLGPAAPSPPSARPSLPLRLVGLRSLAEEEVHFSCRSFWDADPILAVCSTELSIFSDRRNLCPSGVNWRTVPLLECRWSTRSPPRLFFCLCLVLVLYTTELLGLPWGFVCVFLVSFCGVGEKKTLYFGKL